MKLYLIRHTSVNTTPFLCYGQSDVDVSDHFQHEAETVKQILQPTPDMIFYSSPSMRCRKLTESLTSSLYQTDDHLMELNFGDWEKLSWKDIEITPEFKHWADNFDQLETPHGESYQALQARVFKTLLKIVHQHGINSEVVIITHGGPIRAFLAKILNIPLKNSFQKKIDFHSVSLLEITQYEPDNDLFPQFRIIYENRTNEIQSQNLI